MTKRDVSDIELMADFDDAVDAGADRVARPSLSETQQAKVKGLYATREVVRGLLEAPAEGAPDALGDAMWAAISARIEKETTPRAKILVEDRTGQVQATVRTSATSTASLPAAGLWAAMARHRGHFVTAAVSAGVVAAIALWTRPQGEIHSQTAQQIPVATGPSLTYVQANGQVAGQAPGQPNDMGGAPIAQPAVLRMPAQVESLDVAGGTGTVMTIADEDGDTAVIWISPSDVSDL